MTRGERYRAELKRWDNLTREANAYRAMGQPERADEVMGEARNLGDWLSKEYVEIQNAATAGARTPRVLRGAR